MLLGDAPGASEALLVALRHAEQLTTATGRLEEGLGGDSYDSYEVWGVCFEMCVLDFRMRVLVMFVVLAFFPLNSVGSSDLLIDFTGFLDSHLESPKHRRICKLH